jgi:hypothetical protein
MHGLALSLDLGREKSPCNPKADLPKMTVPPEQMAVHPHCCWRVELNSAS